MNKNDPILFGSNWKMNKTVSEARDYVRSLLELMSKVENIEERAQVFLIPPFTAIEAVKGASLGKFWVGAQNMHWGGFGRTIHGRNFGAHALRTWSGLGGIGPCGASPIFQ